MIKNNLDLLLTTNQLLSIGEGLKSNIIKLITKLDQNLKIEQKEIKEIQKISNFLITIVEVILNYDVDISKHKDGTKKFKAIQDKYNGFCLYMDSVSSLNRLLEQKLKEKNYLRSNQTLAGGGLKKKK
jgi:hypothetical protein